MEEILESLDLDKQVKDDLTESFNKAVTVEALALVESKDKEYKELISEKEEKYEEYINEYKTSLEEKMNEYLERVVEEYLEENKLVLENEVKTVELKAITEGFQSLLKTAGIQMSELVEEKESKESFVSEQEIKKAVDAETNKLVKENSELKKSNAEMLKLGLIKEASEGLTEVQKERLGKLANMVELDLKDTDSFMTKLNTLKESIVEQSEQSDQKEKVDESKKQVLDESNKKTYSNNHLW